MFAFIPDSTTDGSLLFSCLFSTTSSSPPPSASRLMSPSLTVLLLLCPRASSTTSANPIPLVLLRLSLGTMENPGLIGPRPIESPLPRTELPPRGGDIGWVSLGCIVERRRLRVRVLEGDSSTSDVMPWRTVADRGDMSGDVSSTTRCPT
jgi:hypothetical protein